MADYAQYRKRAGISNTAMTRALNEIFPKFTKIQASMIAFPEKYGICLTPEAETVLVNKYGYENGLNIKRPRKRKVKRQKNNAITVRLDDSTYDMVKNKMAENGFKSVQEFMESTIEKSLGGCER